VPTRFLPIITIHAALAYDRSEPTEKKKKIPYPHAFI
jgi:hypothetical protein